MQNFSDVIIIGAGAAGLAAAGFIHNKNVTVLERNEKPGKKLYITGKGRCNVTNLCSPSDFLKNVTTNPKFLYSGIYGFTPEDTITLLNSYGVPTKTERGNRVFPKSDKSSDVIKALYAHAVSGGAQFRFGETVKSVSCRNGEFVVETDCTKYRSHALLIATGGKSYPATGSTGDGYAFARMLGHTVIKPVPSLVGFSTKQNLSLLAGLTLKNVLVSIKVGEKSYSEFGEMLYTHEGLSGPTVLRLSAYINRFPFPLKACVDLKPALDISTLDKRIAGDFAEVSNKQLKNSLSKLLPKSLIEHVIAMSGIDGEKKVNVITREERLKLAQTLKNLTYDIVSLGGFENAIVTAGGVDVKELNPKTMESKLINNLYFAGEVIDVDALTGGFNIQAALGTAHAAAVAINDKGD